MVRIPRRPLTRLLRRLGRADARGRWPVGWIGMIGLVAVAELFATRLAPENLVAEAWRQTRIDAGSVAVDASLLAIGDSQTKHGLIVRALDDRLGTRGYNLALQGATAPATYYVLRRALEAGSKPGTIVLNSALLDEDPNNWARPYADLLTLDQLLELSWTARDGRFAGAVALAWLLPSYRERDGLRQEIRGLVRGKRFDPSWFLKAHRRNWRVNRGALVLSLPDEPPTFDHFGLVAARPWNPRPINTVYLERTLALAAERGIPVAFLIYPVHPGVREARGAARWNADEVAYLRSLQARYPGLKVVDGLHGPECPVAYLSDVTHLNRLGAVAFSAAVAEAIREVGPGRAGRWITLPGLGEPRAIAVVVEDDGQSLDALKLSLRAERARRKEVAAAAGALREPATRR